MDATESEKKLIETVIDYGIDYSANLEIVKSKAKRIYIDNISLSGLRAALMSVGKIIEENLEEGYYIAIVSPGSHKTVVVATISDNNLDIMAYAKEGIFKQNSAERAIKQILDELPPIHISTDE